MANIYYIANISREANYWLAEFPDCPGCQTFADNKDELRHCAREALEGWLECALEDEDVPKASVAYDSDSRWRIYINQDLADRISKADNGSTY